MKHAEIAVFRLKTLRTPGDSKRSSELIAAELIRALELILPLSMPLRDARRMSIMFRSCRP